MFDLKQAIQQKTDISTIADQLNACTHEQRYALTQSLNGKDQKALWALCAGRAFLLSDLVPNHVSPTTPVRHLGKNSLPLFSQFEKRFIKTQADENVLWGYNEGSARPLVGPGFFVVRATPDSEIGACVIDYEMLPSDHPNFKREQLPTAWPAIKSNTFGVSRFVYGFMQDYLRKVSDHVSIGRAYRHGKESPNYFVLCRFDE